MTDCPDQKPHQRQPLTPQALFPGLFEAICTNGVFEDAKTWVDLAYRDAPETIMAAYRAEKPQTPEALTAFVSRFFEPPATDTATSGDQAPTIRQAVSQAGKAALEAHIHGLWQTLWRPAHHTADNHGDGRDQAISSIIPLPHPYLVPGGRFSEIYYWDSFFTALGVVDHDPALVGHMIDNFAHLIDRFGFVPNGNRSYYLSRSQPPLLFAMIGLLHRNNPAKGYAAYVETLRKEYTFWMRPDERLVTSLDGQPINRYYDSENAPRQESYIHDLETARTGDTAPSKTPKNDTLFRDIRAAAESGWDFSARWFKGGLGMASIRTTRVGPVDLNAILYGLECALADGYAYLAARDGEAPQADDNRAQASRFKAAAKARADGFSDLFWCAESEFFTDHDLETGTPTPFNTAAGFFPLYFGLASQAQADMAAHQAQATLLQHGGLVTSRCESGEQWDWPNGWAPLQWIAIKGLRRYGHHRLADDIKTRWLKTVQSAFDRTGALYEKYNVVDHDALAGGGEYRVQQGFGWTNGVTLALLKED